MQYHKHSNILEVYLTQVFYGVGTALVGVFIPIYLLELGFSLQQVIIYLLVENLGVVLFSPIASKLSARYGLKHVTIIRIPFFLASFLSLYGLSNGWNPYLLVPAITAAIARPLYWLPIHSLFSKYSHKHSRGSETGKMQALPAFFRVLAPGIGGIIASKLGFPMLLIIGLCMIGLSTLPLLSSADVKAQSHFNYKKLFYKQDNFMKLSALQGFTTIVTAYFFPILIYNTLSTTTSVGTVATIGQLVFASVCYFLGRLLDKVPSGKLMQYGSLFFGLSIIVRPFLSTIEQFSLAIIFGALSFAVYITSYNTMMYETSARMRAYKDDFLLKREIFLNIGRCAALILALLVPWQSLFFIAPTVFIIGSRTFRI